MQQAFFATLSQMAVLILMMMIGFILKRKKITDQATGKILSQLQSYVIMPALVFQTFSQKLTRGILTGEMITLIYGVLALAVSLALAVLLARFFTKDRYIKNIYIYSFTIANLGYMGYSIVGAVFGQDMLFKMMVFAIPFNIFIYSAGFAMLIPGDGKCSWKTLVNPIFIAMLLGSAAGLLELPIPSFLTTTLSSLSNCMGPLAMLLTGFIIAEYNIKEMLSGSRIYIASLLRLVAIPVVVLLILKLCGAGPDLLLVALGTTAMPLGLNTVVFPAAYGGDTRTGASMALISNILGILTIPVMFAIFLT
ncbi:MAG: AEC family transporter [Clostridiaceae bacterium]|nr:AEC family transporter [Clostridiaceae bacterium]